MSRATNDLTGVVEGDPCTCGHTTARHAGVARPLRLWECFACDCTAFAPVTVEVRLDRALAALAAVVSLADSWRVDGVDTRAGASVRRAIEGAGVSASSLPAPSPAADGGAR